MLASYVETFLLVLIACLVGTTIALVALLARKPGKRASASDRDNLQRIRNVTPEIERLLYVQGVRRYSQIGSWKPGDISRIERFLGATGRVTRERWVKQAQKLARGPRSVCMGCWVIAFTFLTLGIGAGYVYITVAEIAPEPPDLTAKETTDAERIKAEKEAKENAEIAKARAEKQAQEKADAERIKAEKEAEENAEIAKARVEKQAQEKADAERIKAEKEAEEKAEIAKARVEKQAQEKADAERARESSEKKVKAKEASHTTVCNSLCLPLETWTAITTSGADPWWRVRPVKCATRSAACGEKVLWFRQRCGRVCGPQGSKWRYININKSYVRTWTLNEAADPLK